MRSFVGTNIIILSRQWYKEIFYNELNKNVVTQKKLEKMVIQIFML